MSNNKKGGFMLQAAILAAAGLISRVIGLLYAVPLYQIIGEEGNGYYGTAYDIYFMILLISTYSIPTAISKVISQRLAVEEYRNANKLFKCSLIYVLVVGSITALVTFVFAPVLVINESVLCLRVMAPTIFFSGLLSVFRGYMQAHDTMVPTAVSQLIEQILNAIVSVGAAYILTRPFVNSVDSSTLAVRGAAGSALGTGVGVVAGLIYMLIIFYNNKQAIDEKIISDKTVNDESYKDLFKVILLIVTPVIMSTFIYNVSTTVDMKLYWWMINSNGLEIREASRVYGIYSRQFLVLLNLPIAISSAMSSALIPGISGAYSKGDIETVNHKLGQAVKTTMLIIIPAAVGMAVLSNPIMQLLFHGTNKGAGYALSAGSAAIVFYAFSTITNGALQAIGKVSAPVKNAAITLVVHVAFVAAGLFIFPNHTLRVLVAGSLVYSFLMCVFNGISIRKYLDFKLDKRKTFVMPLIASIFMGVFANASYFLTYKLMVATIDKCSNLVAIAVSVLTSVFVYGVFVIKIGRYKEEDLSALPKGRLIVKLARGLKLLK